jgi:hypothetical protein
MPAISTTENQVKFEPEFLKIKIAIFLMALSILLIKLLLIRLFDAVLYPNKGSKDLIEKMLIAEDRQGSLGNGISGKTALDTAISKIIGQGDKQHALIQGEILRRHLPGDRVNRVVETVFPIEVIAPRQFS